MCGRVRLSSDVSEIKLVFSIPPHRPTPNFAPSRNAAPTDPLPVVRYDVMQKTKVVSFGANIGTHHSGKVAKQFTGNMFEKGTEPQNKGGGQLVTQNLPPSVPKKLYKSMCCGSAYSLAIV